ncbi:MAG: SigE family polymerase sigma factor [Ilumatobacteraceae bacterium]|nr:SigE family polymerase sigma factor [Ilumatobacteraceae bacterium]
MHGPIDVPSATHLALRRADDRYRLIFEAHRVAVFRLAAMMTNDRFLAEEVTAEVFARVLPRWRRGEVNDALPYLRRAVVNEMRTRHRRRGNEQRALARVGSAVGVGEPIDRLELRESLLVALASLPVRQRAVVVLRYHDDLSEAEVARTLGTSVGTVKTHASRGLEQLRRQLREAT